MKSRAVHAIVVTAGGLAAALIITVVVNSTRWIGTTFPGFFVLTNRVVPSSTLPQWPDVSHLFQRQVVAVEGQPVATANEVYEQVRRHPAGRAIHYTLRNGETTTATVVISRVFSRSDYLLLFGSFLLSGGAFLITGLLVFTLKPHDAAARALLSCGGAVGLFALTAVDLYGPYWFFRLHIIGESLVAPAFLHLALVFPTNRMRGRERLVLGSIYGPFLLLIVAYELLLQHPSSYSGLHLVVTVAQALSGLAIIVAAIFDLLTSHSALVRRRIAVVVLGTLSGFVVPTFLMAGSGIFGGSVAVNGAALTVFFFPLALGYGIVKRDLFEIDVVLRRAAAYGLVVVTIGATYFLALYLGELLVPGQLSSSPIALAALNFALLFLIAPVRERLQQTVDRIFFRQAYQVEEALSTLSFNLASVHTMSGVVERVFHVFQSTCSPNRAAVLTRGDNGRFIDVGRTGGTPYDLMLDAQLATRAQRGEILTRYEWDDGSGRPVPRLWSGCDADLLVPIRAGGALIGMLVLASKSSGRPYSAHDSAFLQPASNQIALALTNATAFAQLEELNVNLERIVEERTGALHTSNAELNRSLDKLRQAYQQLEQTHASLLRAERLATLGRLTAGIAHEVNTPLSAVLNALKILGDLGQEYAAAVTDPDITPEDHQQIARDIVHTTRAAADWTQKAAAYIRSVKAQGREPGPPAHERFTLSSVVTEARMLLAHRLRGATCQIDFSEEPAGVSLVGDPARLGQVILNLCGNAIDAYEDTGTGGRIEVCAKQIEQTVVLTVRDWASGIESDVLPHIFEELFTTKNPGRGTGLGLWISRNLVEQVFGGTLTVETTVGVGSCFRATLPIRAEAAMAA